MKQKPIRISLDLETMSLNNNAAIVQIGACVIGEPDKQFNTYIKPESSERAGLHVDVGTMAWWDKQDALVRARVFGGVVDLQDALEEFKVWCMSLGLLADIKVYTKGEQDITWIKSAYEAVDIEYPLHYRAGQNLRTLEDAVSYLGMDPEQFYVVPDSKHDALSDAVAQAATAQSIFNYLEATQSSAQEPKQYREF